MDMKRILQAMDNTSTKPVEGANDMAKFINVVNESKTNRLTTAEQMVMSSQTVRETITNPVLNKTKDAKPSMIGKYFKTIEQEFAESAERNKDLAKSLAERVASKINESPIAATDDPNDPMIHGHEKANPMTLKGRIHQARNQLKDLANMAESDDLIVWEQICKLAKGGMFMGLEQNLEQIRHGISELAAKRKKGGIQSRGIEKNIGEEAYCDACDRVESKCVCDDHLNEDWQKVNKHDKTDGMSSKAVKAYRRENPGSKLKTAVTTKPSKLKKGSKSAKRRASFCARMSGMKKAHASAKTKRDPDSPINKALRRWNCESIEEMRDLIRYAEQVITEEKVRLDPKCWKGYKKQGTKVKGGVRVNNCVPKEGVAEDANAAQQAQQAGNAIRQFTPQVMKGAAATVRTFKGQDPTKDPEYAKLSPQQKQQWLQAQQTIDASDPDELEKFDANQAAGNIQGMAKSTVNPANMPNVTLRSNVIDRKTAADYPPTTQEGVAEDKDRCPQCGSRNCSCPPNKCKCKPIKGWVPGKGFQKAMKEAQKTGVAGQLRGKDKVDVKGTVLGSPEKSQKGLRGKLVGGSS